MIYKMKVEICKKTNKLIVLKINNLVEVQMGYLGPMIWVLVGKCRRNHCFCLKLWIMKIKVKNQWNKR
jgi:hypothetical protein